MIASIVLEGINIMNPIKSIISRRQAYLSEHFDSSKYGKRLKTLKDTHKGEKCFVIGNGPSLRAEDLTVLEKNGIATFAANRIYKLFENTDWRPTYYACEDEFVLEDIQDKINELDFKYKFIPINFNWFKDIKINNAYYFYQKFDSTLQQGGSRPDFFSEDVTRCIPCRGSVITTCVQLAVYMGFTEIYLIGVDHSFSRMTDKNGNLIVDEKIKDHFGNQKNADENTKGIFNIDTATQSFMDMKEFCDKLNVKVYNATRGGKLEVFPRVDFDDLF